MAPTNKSTFNPYGITLQTQNGPYTLVAGPGINIRPTGDSAIISTATSASASPPISASWGAVISGTLGSGWAGAFTSPFDYAPIANKVSITKIWSQLAHDGVSEFYTTPIYYPNFVSSGYTGAAIIFQGYDWFVYVVNALTGAAISGFPVATTGPCYGRCQAANIGAGGTTIVFAATHGNQSGQTGSIYAISSAGSVLWNVYNVYQDEGYNDGIANSFTYNGNSYVTVGGTTSAGGAISSAGTFSITVAGAPTGWPTNAWQRVEGIGSNALVAITSGTGAGQKNEISGVSGNVIFLNNAWSPTPDATSTFQIIPRFASDVVFQHAGTLNVESGTNYLYTTGDDNTIVKRNAATGAKIWRYWAGENNEPFPLIAPVTDGVTPSVLFNCIDGNTYCLTLAGSLNWKTLGTSGVGLDSFLAAANISNNVGYLNVVVNQRRSGNTAAGRTYVLRGDTGAKVSESGDQLGDNSSGPLLIPRNDGSSKYYVFSSGNACLTTLYDDQMNGLWRNRYADNSGIDQFRSSPILIDMNYDGVEEIVQCFQNSGSILVLSQAGSELAQLTLPCRLNATDDGIEGTPCTFTANGLLYIVIPSKDGTVSCWQVNKQN